MATEVDDDRRGRFRLDKTINLPFLFLVLVQGGVALWWASGANTRLTKVEEQIKASVPQAELVIRLDERVRTVQTGIDEIKAALDGRPPTPRR